jgi:hypothetical protein
MTAVKQPIIVPINVPMATRPTDGDLLRDTGFEDRAFAGCSGDRYGFKFNSSIAKKRGLPGSHNGWHGFATRAEGKD